MDRMLQLATEKLPVVQGWIDDTLAEHAHATRTVASLEFTRLPSYFDVALLDQAKVVATDRLPQIPFDEMGLGEFVDFGNMPAVAITYVDTYFIDRRHADDESLHFHELIHVIQWLELGVDRFLVAYAFGLLTAGYEGSPLEVQARSHQHRFDNRDEPYDVRAEVRTELATVAGDLAGLLGIREDT